MAVSTGLYLTSNVDIAVANVIVTAPANCAIIAMNATNKTNAVAYFDLFVSRGGANTYLEKGIKISANNTLIVMGNMTNKHFLNNGDILLAFGYQGQAIDLATSIAIGVS